MTKEGYAFQAPAVPQSFRVFAQHFSGPQWDVKFLQPAAEPLFDQMFAYVVGYARLTCFNKSFARRLFENWSAAEKVEKLRLLAELSGFLEIE